MTDRPIIFSSAMILALLAGRKTMTRRLAYDSKGRPTVWAKRLLALRLAREERERVLRTIKGLKPGDRLWCREAHLVYTMGGTQVCAYRCTDTSGQRGPWRPSIHMPRWASRLTLVVASTKIERLQEISEEDAKREGAICYDESTHSIDEDRGSYRGGFRGLWDLLHGPCAWDENPDIVTLSFSVHATNIDAMDRDHRVIAGAA